MLPGPGPKLQGLPSLLNRMPVLGRLGGGILRDSGFSCVYEDFMIHGGASWEKLKVQINYI